MRRNSMEEVPPEMSAVNIMLLGLTGVGKSASGNTILGVHKLQEDYSPSSVTRTCESAQAEIDGQTVTVIDTVGLSDEDLKITDVQIEIEQMLKKTNLDVFLLVIRLGEHFTKEKVQVVNWIKENFGSKVLKHTIVLFTQGDQLRVPIEDYVSRSERLRSVVDQCSGGCHVFNNRNGDRSQVTELMEKINRLRIKNEYRRYTEQDYANAQKHLLIRKCAAGAAVGAAVGAAGGAVLSTVGVAAVASTGGAALAAAAIGAGVYFMARKSISRKKD